MTTSDLGPGLAYDADPEGDPPGALDSSGALGTLFDTSPAREVSTSAAAETAFVLGLVAVLAVPFPLAMTLCVGLAGVAVVSAIFGMARASKPGFAGGVLAAVGLVLALATLSLVGLRYIGVDTAVGDGLVPTLRDWLTALNGLLPAP